MDIDVRVPAAADPEVIHALLCDGATWPEWAPLGSFELVRESAGGGEGIGAVRLFRTGRHRSYEEIVELVPERRLSYVLLPESNLPFRTYRADVDLDGRSIRWHSTFDVKWPGAGRLTKLAFGRFIAKTARGLAARADAEMAARA